MRKLQEILEWCGFTPTQREAALRRQLEQTVALAGERRRTVQRVEQLLHFREGLGATSVDTASLRGALYGEEEQR